MVNFKVGRVTQDVMLSRRFFSLLDSPALGLRLFLSDSRLLRSVVGKLTVLDSEMDHVVRARWFCVAVLHPKDRCLYLKILCNNTVQEVI
jgi:hypothetical protein